VPASSTPIDDRAIRIARAALDRDAGEAGRAGSVMNLALERQERGKATFSSFPP